MHENKFKEATIIALEILTPLGLTIFTFYCLYLLAILIT